MNQTRTLSNIGEQASAYIILRVMYDEIDIVSKDPSLLLVLIINNNV